MLHIQKLNSNGLGYLPKVLDSRYIPKVIDARLKLKSFNFKVLAPLCLAAQAIIYLLRDI